MCGEDLSLLGLSKRDRGKVTFGTRIRTCGIAGCQYKTGVMSDMKKHKAAKHGINGVHDIDVQKEGEGGKKGKIL